MSAAEYRVDRRKKDSSTYDLLQVPVGMDSIVYLGNRPPPQRFTVTELKADEILVYSKWSQYRSSFIVYRIN